MASEDANQPAVSQPINRLRRLRRAARPRPSNTNGTAHRAGNQMLTVRVAVQRRSRTDASPMLESTPPASRAGEDASHCLARRHSPAGASARDVAAIQPGKTATLDVLHDGTDKSVNVQLAALPSDQASPQQGKIGVALAPLVPELRDRLGLPEDAQGAVIAEVQQGSPAAQAGLQPGDLVVGVGGPHP